MSIRQFAVLDTATLHLLDALGNPMYAGTDDQGKPAMPIELILYSPGSKEFAAAEKARQDATMRAVQRGKAKRSLARAKTVLREREIALAKADASN